MKELSSEGWLVSRSAMSHGPVDIFAAKDGRSLLIQVKSGKGRLNSEQRRELTKWAKEFGAEAQLWQFSVGRGRTITTIYKASRRAERRNQKQPVHSRTGREEKEGQNELGSMDRNGQDVGDDDSSSWYRPEKGSERNLSRAKVSL